MADDHKIVITPAGRRVKVVWRGRIVADSASALSLKEHVYPPVFYIPRKDVDMSLLHRTPSHTTCPYKGEASYYSLAGDGVIEKDAVWTYETPLPGVASIKEHLAFYPNKVEIGEG
ncbi:MAG TPA: DUF427 domain-containing protein [Roseiarcus sp.]|jgi:uncharacterized protein (DUF427 family)|nr:DUF427 domain-containing protein [Roseiarcus sp.]